MRLLSIDSSGNVATVAIVDENGVVAEYSVNYKKTHSQTLLPMVDEVLRMAETDMSSIDAIAIGEGPGSFTGLRIGAATAKGLAFPRKLPIVPVSVTAALAYNLFGTGDSLICPIMDARRSQVYTGTYCFENGEMVELVPARAMALSDLLAELGDKADDPSATDEAGRAHVSAKGRNVIFLGDGVPVYRKMIEESAGFSYSFAPAHMSLQRASSVGLLGMKLMKDGHSVEGAEFAPIYLRMSQAEREREEAGK